MSLRRSVLQGGAYLALRQGIGMAIGLAGVLILTRQIGPANYGVYAADLGIFGFLQSLCGWGLNIYLVRSDKGGDRAVIHQAFTLLLLLGGLGGLFTYCVSPLLARWTHLEALGPATLPILAVLPVNLAGQAPLAQLERQLAYRSVAMIELAGQMVLYLIALPLAFLRYGVWAPIIGWSCQQVLVAVLRFRVARYTPRLRWDLSAVREMIGYGLSFSSSLWIWQLRLLINPLVVGRYAGADAVGFVALSIRVVEYLSFVQSATWRLSIAALARIQDSAEKLRQAISEGLRLQVLALGPIAVAFLWMSPFLIPRLFGQRWRPALPLIPFIALAYLANSMFNMHSSVLYVRRRNWSVAVFHTVHVLLIAGSAYALIPRFGIIGYGYAEILALVSYVVIDWQVSRIVGRPDYGLAIVWFVAFGASLFVYQVGWWPVLALVAAASLPATWSELTQISRHMLQLRRA